MEAVYSEHTIHAPACRTAGGGKLNHRKPHCIACDTMMTRVCNISDLHTVQQPMDGEELFSGLVAFCLLVTGLATTFLLLQHLSSILAIRLIIDIVICPHLDQAGFQEDTSHSLERLSLHCNSHMCFSKGGVVVYTFFTSKWNWKWSR